MYAYITYPVAFWDRRVMSAAAELEEDRAEEGARRALFFLCKMRLDVKLFVGDLPRPDFNRGGKEGR
jgi:hypothetical protein